MFAGKILKRVPVQKRMSRRRRDAYLTRKF